MTCTHKAADLLPVYAAGTASAGECREVEAHLAHCESCRTDLATWEAVGGAVSDESAAAAMATPACERALAKVVSRRASLVERAWTFLVAQVPLVGSDIWLASALVMAVGYVVAVLVGRQAVLDAVAPLVASGAVAAVYRPSRDAAFELVLATPTSPRQILLARLVLVFGYNLALALAASLALAAALPHSVLGAIIAGWLAPMTFLSALALVLSLAIGAGNAMAVAFGLWLLRGFPAAHPQFPGADAARAIAAAYRHAWHESAWLMVLAAVLVAVALWLAGKSERPLAAS